MADDLLSVPDGDKKKKMRVLMQALGIASAVALFAVLVYLLISLVRTKRPLRNVLKSRRDGAGGAGGAEGAGAAGAAEGTATGGASTLSMAMAEEAPTTVSTGQTTLKDVRTGESVMVDADVDDTWASPAPWGSKSMLQSMFVEWSTDDDA